MESELSCFLISSHCFSTSSALSSSTSPKTWGCRFISFSCKLETTSTIEKYELLGIVHNFESQKLIHYFA